MTETRPIEGFPGYTIDEDGRIRNPKGFTVTEKDGYVRLYNPKMREVKARDLLLDTFRPKTRGECVNGPRPCPWVGCRYHLGIRITSNGKVKECWPGVLDGDLSQVTTSCALDVAEEGDHTYEKTGELMNLTRQRVQQIELRGLMNPRMRGILSAWRDHNLNGGEILSYPDHHKSLPVKGKS